VELYDPKSGWYMPSSSGIGMHVEVRDPYDKTVLSRVSGHNYAPFYNHQLILYKYMYNYLRFNLQVYSLEGGISFTSHTPGEHIICLYSNSSNWSSGSQLVSGKLSKWYVLIIYLYYFLVIPFYLPHVYSGMRRVLSSTPL
jgi:hypothetical protein